MKSTMDYPGRFRVIKPGEGESDLSSMLSLMMLGLTCGTEVEVEVEGPDEEAWCRKLVELLEKEYDFPNAGAGA